MQCHACTRITGVTTVGATRVWFHDQKYGTTLYRSQWLATRNRVHHRWWRHLGSSLEFPAPLDGTSPPTQICNCFGFVAAAGIEVGIPPRSDSWGRPWRVFTGWEWKSVWSTEVNIKARQLTFSFQYQALRETWPAMGFRVLSALPFLLPSVLSGGIFGSIDDLPTDVNFDFLIVGGQLIASCPKTLALYWCISRWYCWPSTCA